MQLTQIKFHSIRSVFWVITLFFLASCANEIKVTDEVLAIIGERVITKGDFVARYKDFRRRTGSGVYDTYAARRAVLLTYMNEEILISEAERRGYVDDREGQLERARIEIQQLLNSFTKNMIAAKVTVSDEELKRLFVRLNTKVKARHLYASDKSQADSIYASLQGGATFGELAKELFDDPELRDSGGMLGYFSMEDMEPDFEEAAFGLSVGQISQPVRTRDGYSIIMVEDRITKPLLTESEFAKHKPKLHAYFRGTKIKQAMKAFSDSVGQELQITFNEDVLKKLYDQFESRTEHKIFSEDTFGLKRQELRTQKLVSSDLGSWDVAAFQEKAQFTSAKQHEWIRSEQHFREFISGLIVREFILKNARKANLHKESEYLQKVTDKQDIYLLTRMEQTLRNEMQVPQDSVHIYFEANADLFDSPAKINLREIVLSDKNLALEVEKKLKSGAPFPDLASQYSERRSSAETGGELGYLTAQDLGKWSARIFSMQVGKIAGPLEMDSKLVFLQCLDKKPSVPRTFEQARADVEKTVRYIMWEDYRDSKINEYRASIERVAVFPEKLKTVRLN